MDTLVFTYLSRLTKCYVFWLGETHECSSRWRTQENAFNEHAHMAITAIYTVYYISTSLWHILSNPY